MADKEGLKKQAQQVIDTNSQKLFSLADAIWDNPEYNFKEFKSSRLVADFMESQGFVVTMGSGGIETAFTAVYDSGKPGPHIGFLAEYDAVPGMGHACGHNLMAAMAAGAGVGLKSVLHDLCGKITVFGCPAEEGGGGKVILLEQGVFDGVDAAMIIHAANETVVNDLSYSRTDLTINFHGRKAHAATWPEEGINALSPILHVFQHINQMRLTWNGRGTILGIITKGGEDPIMIPEHCQAKFTVRSFNIKFKKELLREFLEACENIAKLTKTEFDYTFNGYTYEAINNNPVIENLLSDNFTALGETVMPRRKELGIGCTDVGNLTHEFPSLQSYVQVVPILRGHTKEFEEACHSPEGHRSILVGAKAMAMTAVDLLCDEELRKQMTDAFMEAKKRNQ